MIAIVQLRLIPPDDRPLLLAARAPAPVDPAVRDVRRHRASLQSPITSDRPEPSVQLDQTSIRALVASPARCSDAQIHAALARADHDDAAARALARLRLGDELPADLVAPILVGVTRSDAFLALAGHAAGDLAGELEALLARRAFAADRAGIEQTVLALFALWRLGPAERVRPIILPRLRRAVRLALHLGTQGLVVWLAHTLADPHVLTLLDAYRVPFDPEDRDGWAAFAETSFLATADEVIKELPERAAESLLPGRPARAAPRVGRNELCPCGSGKKFKRCCADKPDAEVAAGPPRADQLAELAPRFKPDEIRLLSRRDLAQLPLDRLRDPALVTVMRRHATLRDWPRARAVLASIRARPSLAADEWLDDLVHLALDAQRADVARELLGDVTYPESRAAVELASALASSTPEALPLLRARARAVAEDASGEQALALAYTLLDADPALGILVARGVLDADRPLDTDTLLDAIEEARDELLLAPFDPVGDRFADLFDDDDDDDDPAPPAAPTAQQAALADEAAKLRAEVDEASQRLATLQREAARHERELRAAETAAAEAARRATAASEPDHRALRAKVDELKSLITEGNQERAALRRQLADAADTPRRSDAGASDRRHTADADDDLTEAFAPTGGRRFAVPDFSDRARAALGSVAHNVAAQALRHVGSLAAGDSAAWRGVKQAKDMPRQVLMTRIGIHHRLLFRADDGTLEVLDLVTRESLLTTLKHLRGA